MPFLAYGRPTNNAQAQRDPNRMGMNPFLTNALEGSHGSYGAPPIWGGALPVGQAPMGIANQNQFNPSAGMGGAGMKPQNVMQRNAGFFRQNPFLNRMRQRGVGVPPGQPNPAWHGTRQAGNTWGTVNPEQDPYAGQGNTGGGGNY